MKTNRIAALLGTFVLGITTTTGAFAQAWTTGGVGNLVTNAATSRVGILTSAPTATLDVNGNTNISSDCGIGGNLTVSGITYLTSANMSSDCGISGILTVSGISNVQDLNVNGNLNVNMNSNFNQNVNFNQNANFNTDINVNNNATVIGTVTASAYITSSDARLKENIVPVKDVLTKLENIQPVYFTYNTVLPRPTAPQLGFIAQEVQKQFPQLVTTMDNGYLGVAYGNMSAVAIEAVKEQQKTIQQLSDENKALNARIERLEQALQQLTGCCPEPAKATELK